MSRLVTFTWNVTIEIPEDLDPHSGEAIHLAWQQVQMNSGIAHFDEPSDVDPSFNWDRAEAGQDNDPDAELGVETDKRYEAEERDFRERHSAGDPAAIAEAEQ